MFWTIGEQTYMVYYPIISYWRIHVYMVETMDMGRSHWNNGVIGTLLISIVLQYWFYEIRYFGRIPTMIYVCTWNNTLNNVRFLLSNMSKEHGRLITYINKLHPYWESYRLFPTFYTRTYESITNAIVSSIEAGHPINAWPDIFIHLGLGNFVELIIDKC